jgi:LPS-assembly protein
MGRWAKKPRRTGLTLLLAAALPLGAGAQEREEVNLKANRLTVEEDRAIAEGEVRARQGDRRMRADRLVFDRATGWMELSGAVRLWEPGYVVDTPAARFNTRTELGEVESPRLHLENNDSWLLAEGLERYAPSRFRLDGACYTACTPPEDPPWALRSSQVYVNQESHFAHHWNSRFELGGVPVFYTPYFGHYTDTKRHTGFLYPAFEFSGERGTDIAVPFYWNIAPQLDATIGVRNMTAHGTMPQLEVRHLGPDVATRVYGEFLSNDDATGEDRYYGVAEQEGTLPGNVGYQLDAKRVSDPEYLSLFGSGVESGSQRFLASNLTLSRNWAPYRLSASFNHHQDLVDFNADDTLQELPRMRLEGEQGLFSPGGATRFALDSEYVYFYRREGDRTHRLYADPELGYTLDGRYGTLQPRAGVHWTGYRFLPEGEGGVAETRSRTLPHVSLRADSEVFRVFQWGDTAFRHSIGPELFYLYVPYRDQTDLPRLDTNEPPLRVDDLFDMNRFSGVDRIGDANQLTTALGTRLEARSGDRYWEAAALRVGQIRYFRDRRVTLDPDAAPDTRGYSNVFAEYALRPIPGIALEGALEYDPDRPSFSLDQMDLFESRLALEHPRGHRLEAEYLLRTQAGVDEPTTEEIRNQARVVLSPAWEVFGTYRYSFKFREVLENRLGVDYHAGCWGLRLAWEDRLLRRDSAGEHETTLYLTLRFRTLGEYEFGTDPKDLEQNLRELY